MPIYDPTPEDLQQVFHAVRDAGLLDMPGPYLLSHLERLASGNPPPGLAGIALPGMRGNQRCLHLAIALAMVRPQALWNSHDACAEFHQIASDLVTTWGTAHHTDAQKMRKTIDHVMAFGARQAWQGATEATYYTILGDPVRFVPGWPPHTSALPARLPIGAIEASLAHLVSLIPGLAACWGGPIESEASLHTAYIQNRLLQPTSAHQLRPGDGIEFSSNPEGVHFNILFRAIPPGSSRTFLLADGSAALMGPRGFVEHVPAGQRLIVRALDEGDAEIQLAQFVPNPKGGAMGGRTCKLHDGEAAQLVAGVESMLQAWACTCGKWQCDKRHRLEAWDPRAIPPNGSLRTFIWTAVKGPTRGFELKSFITGMYYALLCEGV